MQAIKVIRAVPTILPKLPTYNGNKNLVFTHTFKDKACKCAIHPLQPEDTEKYKGLCTIILEHSLSIHLVRQQDLVLLGAN